MKCGDSNSHVYDAPRARWAKAVNICLLTHSPQPVVIPFHSRGEPGHEDPAEGGPVSGPVGLPRKGSLNDASVPSHRLEAGFGEQGMGTVVPPEASLLGM